RSCSIFPLFFRRGTCGCRCPGDFQLTSGARAVGKWAPQIYAIQLEPPRAAIAGVGVHNVIQNDAPRRRCRLTGGLVPASSLTMRDKGYLQSTKVGARVRWPGEGILT